MDFKYVDLEASQIDISRVKPERKTIELFGKRIRELCKARGWSQEHFADEANLDRGYMGRLERGETNVTLKNIARIALALDVPISDLFVKRE